MRPAFFKAAWLLGVGMMAQGLFLTMPALAVTGTGKVSLEGALTANYLEPEPGDVIVLYLNVTPLETTPRLRLRLSLPEGLELLAGGTGDRTFSNVAAEHSVSLALPVRVTRGGPLTVNASATMFETASRKLSRAFVLVLNPAPPPESQAVFGRSGEGRPLIIFPSGK